MLVGILIVLGTLTGCGASSTATAPEPTGELNTPLPTLTSVPASATPAPTSPASAEDGPTRATAETEPAGTPSATPEPGLHEEPFATLGSPDAPITIYEFSDFGCPACQHYHLNTFPAILAEYIDTGQVRYVYKNFPVVSDNGGLAAEAAECAGEQDAYWDMHHQLFLDPPAWSTVSDEAAAEVFGGYAAELGLDADALEACVSERRYQEEVTSDVEEAHSLGWFGTPTFIINRKLLSGAQSTDVFRSVLDRELELIANPPQGAQPASGSSAFM